MASRPITTMEAGWPSGSRPTKRVSPHVWSSASSMALTRTPRSPSAPTTSLRVGVARGVPMARLTTADIAQPSPSAPMIDPSGPTAATAAPSTASTWMARTVWRTGRTR